MFREDGYMDAWDMLYQQAAPVLSSKVTQISNRQIKNIRYWYCSHDCQVSDAPLNCIQVQSEGFLVAVGCEDGNTSLLELSDSLCQCTRCLIL